MLQNTVILEVNFGKIYLGIWIEGRVVDVRGLKPGPRHLGKKNLLNNPSLLKSSWKYIGTCTDNS